MLINNLNPIISTNNASIFQSITKNKKFNYLFMHLNNHITTIERLPLKNLSELLKALYPRSTNDITINIKDIIKNLTHIPEHKLEQILFSYRIDDIYEILLTQMSILYILLNFAI